MKIINSYDEYSKIISPKMKKIFYTNNFLSENEVKTEIQAKGLYYSEVKEDVYIFRKRKNHFIMNYYIEDMMLRLVKHIKVKLTLLL